MTALTKEIELLAGIQGLFDRNQDGLTAGFGDNGGIVIEKRKHVRGLWHSVDGAFAWTPAGYNEPIHTAPDIAAAVAFTRALFIGK